MAKPKVDAIDLFSYKYGETYDKDLFYWENLIQKATPELRDMPRLFDMVKDIQQKTSRLTESQQSATRKVPASEIIGVRKRQSKRLSQQLRLKNAEIENLKQVLSDSFKPTLLKKVCIHISILSIVSLLVSFIYKINLIHPLLAAPLMLASLGFYIISFGLKKNDKS